LGCMFSWINMIQYFEYDIRYYTMVLTLKRGTPRVLNFVIGVLPIFIGFVFFGMANFSYSVRFKGFDGTFTTLYSSIFGDDLLGTYFNITMNDPIVGRVYLTVFLLLFIFVVANTFIFIIEEAFDFAKRLERRKLERENRRKAKEKKATSTYSMLRKGVSTGLLLDKITTVKKDHADVSYSRIEDTGSINADNKLFNDQEDDNEFEDEIEKESSRDGINTDSDVDSEAVEIMKKLLKQVEALTKAQIEMRNQLENLQKKGE